MAVGCRHEVLIFARGPPLIILPAQHHTTILIGTAYIAVWSLALSYPNYVFLEISVAAAVAPEREWSLPIATIEYLYRRKKKKFWQGHHDGSKKK